jgi:prenyltransferase beta subunit
MSVRRETLQVARLAPKLLSDSADLVVQFVRSRLTAEGGFSNRAGDADLYYTLFGLQSLIALRSEVPAALVKPYLRRFDAGEHLDLVHLACLAGCWAALSMCELTPSARDAILDRVETYRTPDGGYHAAREADHGTAYHTLLALGAYQDLGSSVPAGERLVSALPALRSGDGAFANGPGQTRGSTPATAAAVTIMRHFDTPVPPGVADWLMARSTGGGFVATPDAPVPDLLSTATALHALRSLHASIDAIREPCLDFVDSLWTNQGGFYGHWADDGADCEYTFYGLLALGHLAV